MDKIDIVKHSAARQFRHNNDNSPDRFNPKQGFVAAYDREIIDAYIDSQANRIDELEAKLEESDESELKALARAGEAEAQLDAVRGLPDKWRSRTDGYSNVPLARKQCADELQQALEQKESK